MASTSSIQIQMNEFQSVSTMLASKMDLFESSLHEVLAELNNVKGMMHQAVKDSGGEGGSAAAFVETETGKVLTECDKLRKTLKELCELDNDCKNFQKLEANLRGKFTAQSEEFDMASVDALVKAKMAAGEQPEHPKYRSFCELIEDFKSGNMPEDDLVMESNHQEVAKCPITGKPMQEPVKNSKCDHVYERSAILAYTKAKTQKKCPFAGCTAMVFIPPS